MNYIYKFTNKENGKVYIGQSIKPYERYKQHFYGNSPFDIELRALGADAFTFEIIDRVAAKDADDKEISWIRHYDSFNNGYNSTRGGSGIYIPRQVWCLELDIEFDSLREAAGAIICAAGLAVSIETVRRNISRTLNKIDEDAYGFHFYDTELREMVIEDQIKERYL